jgi:type IV secretory pathway VirJ component
MIEHLEQIGRIMKPSRRTVAIELGLLLFAATVPRASAKERTISHGRFREVEIMRPAGDEQGVAIVFTSAKERNGSHAAARALAGRGAFVVLAPVEPLLASLETDAAGCVSPDGDVENLSHFVQAYAKLGTYRAPVLIGTASTSGLAYALLAQAPAGTFAGGIGIDFCPRVALAKPLCNGGYLRGARANAGGVDLQAPANPVKEWVTLATSAPPRCDASTAREFAAKEQASRTAAQRDVSAALADVWARRFVSNGPHLTPAPAEVADLPIIEVEAQGTGGDLVGVMLSGDGGWAGIDRDLASAFARAGIPVVGIDSLRYFWTARTPESTAADVDRVIRFALSHFKRSRVLLVGYSQGADVLPFVANRLPAATREHLALVAMLGLGRLAEFEFHLTNWIVTTERGLPTRPELARLPAGLALCVYGAEEDDSGCLDADPQRVRVVKLPGGHHFGGDDAQLANAILGAAAPQGAVTPTR